MVKNVTDNQQKRITQITQTRMDFVTGLNRLLEQHQLEDLTVSRVSKEAGYARRTFYRHFYDLSDVLEFEIDLITKDLFQQIKNAEVDRFSELILQFFKFWVSHKSVLEILNRNGRLELLQHSWFTNIDLSSFNSYEFSSNLYGQDFGMGGMFFMLIRWIHTGFKETPEEMVEIGNGIVDHILEIK